MSMSSPTKHAKGPWHVIRFHGLTKVVDYYGETICDDEDYYPQKLDPDNADIIAASPELLDVVKLFCDYFTDYDIRWEEKPDLKTIYDTANAVIAKAEGRTV